jgi:adenylate cyclase
VAEILADPGIRRRATGLVYGTCMAVRVHRSGADRDGADPAVQGNRLIEVFRNVEQTLSRQRGVVTEQTRYSRLAVWVSPSPDSRLRQAACQAGMTLQPNGQASPDASLHIGLHSGRMAIDCRESGDGELRRSFGPIVDAAERIEALNAVLGTSFLVSAETLQGMTGWQHRSMGRFLFSGIADPLELVEIRGRQRNGEDVTDGWLCREFASALDAYQRGDPDECSDVLLEILEQFPKDGPSHYYLQRCEYFRRHPPIAGWDSLIRL